MYFSFQVHVATEVLLDLGATTLENAQRKTTRTQLLEPKTDLANF
jgi:hypothetical protein